MKQDPDSDSTRRMMILNQGLEMIERKTMTRRESQRITGRMNYIVTGSLRGPSGFLASPRLSIVARLQSPPGVEQT